MTQFSPHEERDFTRELRAGAVIEEYFDDYPKHPGLYHCLLHAYDSAELAHKALEAAQGYDKLALNTPHALHMPSHIFVRLGHWEEGEVLPVRELYADLLLKEEGFEQAKAVFEASLQRTPNRRNALAGLEKVESRN